MMGFMGGGKMVVSGEWWWWWVDTLGFSKG